MSASKSLESISYGCAELQRVTDITELAGVPSLDWFPDGCDLTYTAHSTKLHRWKRSFAHIICNPFSMSAIWPWKDLTLFWCKTLFDYYRLHLSSSANIKKHIIQGCGGISFWSLCDKYLRKVTSTDTTDQERYLSSPHQVFLFFSMSGQNICIVIFF